MRFSGLFVLSSNLLTAALVLFACTALHECKAKPAVEVKDEVKIERKVFQYQMSSFRCKACDNFKKIQKEVFRLLEKDGWELQAVSGISNTYPNYRILKGSNSGKPFYIKSGYRGSKHVKESARKFVDEINKRFKAL